MAASIVQQNEGAQNTGDATVDATLGSGCAAGNTIVVIVGADDYRTAGGIPTGFTESTGCKQETFLGHYLWWKVATGGETTFGYTIGSASPSCWEVFEISGLHASAPYDVSNGQFAQSSGTSYTTPTITPTAGDRYLVGSIGGSLSNTLSGVDTWLNSFTEREDTFTTLASGTRDVIGMADRSVTADGLTGYSTGASYTGATTCQSRTGIIVAFKVAAAAAAYVRPTVVTPKTAVHRSRSW